MTLMVVNCAPKECVVNNVLKMVVNVIKRLENATIVHLNVTVMLDVNSNTVGKVNMIILLIDVTTTVNVRGKLVCVYVSEMENQMKTYVRINQYMFQFTIFMEQNSKRMFLTQM